MNDQPPRDPGGSVPSPVITTPHTPSEPAAQLACILDRYLADLQAGRAPDRAALLAAHPEFAAELEQCLSGIDFVQRATHPDEAPAQLGDFRILREVGRGGMGVVYEAIQVSLHRQVALKVLRCTSVGDTEALQRFQREAETIARLHHTNIVPIFAVGVEQGVHYYAMQFIDGRSLSLVLEQASGPLAPSEVASLGLQAAEALAHAHQRGVIHRDIKPSNLLLDRTGVLWLTDFGLARHQDEVTLTVTGMIMGTPRYMSPEQAEASKRTIDHRTDIYSLGATLYELATGRPVFNATSPQEVISQILHSDPASPRDVQRQVPRDLETIILKCLAKEQDQRYQTAQNLADDLRAFHEGRAIQARRPNLVERAARWLRRHRRSAALMAVTAVMAATFVIAGVVGWELYRQWQLGFLMLFNDGPPLIGELVDASGKTVQSRFTIPTEEPLALPAGAYQLHVRGRGYLGETIQVHVERGREQAFHVSLDSQRLWPARQVEGSYETCKLGQREEVFALSPTGVSRCNGSTGEVLWTTKLEKSDDPRLAGFRWDWSTGGSPSGRNQDDRRPRLLKTAVDIDGDGVGDLVWWSQRQVAVLALSGKDGKLLWCFQGPTPKLKERFLDRDEASTGIVVGLVKLADVDRDGTVDFAAVCVSQQQENNSVPRWVEGLSGRTGKSLWRYDLKPEWFTAPDGVPADALWNNEIGISWSSSSRIQSGPDILYEKDWGQHGGLPIPYLPGVARVSGKEVVTCVAGRHLIVLDPAKGTPIGKVFDLEDWPLRAPQIADLDGDSNSDLLVLRYGVEVKEEPKVTLQPGEVLPPDVTKFLPPALAQSVQRRNRTDDRLELLAVSLASRQPMWRTSFRGYWGWNWFQESFAWPLIADLDNDRATEVVVPDGDFETDTKWSGVRVIDGATGQTRWIRKLSRSSRFGQVQQINRFLVGPDVDGDGHREIFTAVLDGEFLRRDRPYRSFSVLNMDKDYHNPVILIDALSGKDGHNLWWTRKLAPSASLTTSPKPSVGELHWFHAVADGLPQLIVPYVPGSPQSSFQNHMAYFVAASTGKVINTGTDYPELRTVDLDGDGVFDLLAFRPEKPGAFDQGGRLETIRGRSPELWRRFSGVWKNGGDLDGDGIADLITTKPISEQREARERERNRTNISASSTSRSKQQSQAISGRDGKALWKRAIDDGQKHTPWEDSMFTHLHPSGVDLNGDGFADLFATGSANTNFVRHGAFSPLVAVSGRTGNRLWSADLSVETWNGPQLLSTCDLDNDGEPEVLFVSAMDLDWPIPRASHSIDDGDYWLTVLSGRDGKLRWKQRLSEGRPKNQSWTTRPFAHALRDLNGDGVLDIVIEGGAPGTAGDVRALSGIDGKVLWHWRPQPSQEEPGRSHSCQPTFCVDDVDGDGQLEVVVLYTRMAKDTKDYSRLRVVVAVLNGATGAERATWQEAVHNQFNDCTNGAIRSHVSPVIVSVQGQGKSKGICVLTYDYTRKGRIVLLDAHARELRQESVKFRINGSGWQRYRDDPKDTYAPYYGDLFKVWVVDWAGAGQQAILYLSSSHLIVRRDGLGETALKWPLPEDDLDVLEVRSATPTQKAKVILRAGSRVFCLDSTGQLQWSCSGPGKPISHAQADGQQPRVYYELGNEVTAARMADSLDAPRQIPVLERGAHSGDDPRLVVALPWNPIARSSPVLPTSPAALAGTLLLWSTLGIAVPAWVVWIAWRRRIWVLWPVLPAWIGFVWGAGYLLFFAYAEDEALWQIYNVGQFRFILRVGYDVAVRCLLGLPLLAFVVGLGLSLWYRRWWRLLLLLVMCGVVVLPVGMVWLARFSEPLGPEQRFSSAGWAQLWPAGVYLVGAGLFVYHAVRITIAFFLSVARRMRKKTP